MCGRYRRTTSEEELARLYKIPIPPQIDLPISYNIAPKQDVLVIRYKRVLIVSQSFWFGRKWTPVSEIGPQLCEKVFKQWFRKACPRVADIEQSAFVVDS